MGDVERNELPAPGTPDDSWPRPSPGDVWPILDRPFGYQWVNKFNRRGHWPIGPAMVANLGDVGRPGLSDRHLR